MFCFGVAAGTEPRDARQGGALGAQWRPQCQDAAQPGGMMGTYRFIHTPTLHFTWQVIRPDGLPHMALTFAANEWLRSLSASTVPVYLRELIAFLRWASTDRIVQANGWTLQGSPAEVRNLVREYLCSGAQCKVTARPDRNGLRILHVRTTDQTHINVRIFLSALKRLFDTLGGAGMYAFPNPLRHEDAERIARQLQDDKRAAIYEAQKREPMPAVSGVDTPRLHFGCPKTTSGSQKGNGYPAVSTIPIFRTPSTPRGALTAGNCGNSALPAPCLSPVLAFPSFSISPPETGR